MDRRRHVVGFRSQALPVPGNARVDRSLRQESVHTVPDGASPPTPDGHAHHWKGGLKYEFARIGAIDQPLPVVTLSRSYNA